MSKKIRKQGKKAQRARAALYVKSDAGHWFRRIIKEQKDSPRVQEAVLSGKLDAWLGEGNTK